jgi:two-component system sensor histidine kinase TctE
MVDADVAPRLAVEDDGPGIPAAERQKIFERFYRLPSAGGDGCGLGLSIVREIASLHDAQVEVASGDAGRGVRFSVTFSAATVEAL